MARIILNDMADFEIGSDNVYADLGFADSSAMLVKAQLTSKIRKGLDARALTPVTAAELLGISPSRLSDVFRGHFRMLSKQELMNCVSSVDCRDNNGT